MSNKKETKETKVKKVSKKDLLLANAEEAAKLRKRLLVLKEERTEIENK